MSNPGICDKNPKIENELLDIKIEKAKQLFLQELARKKRNIKRQWMEINAVTNNHFLQLLPYRSLLNHVSDLTAERRAEIYEKERKSACDEIGGLHPDSAEGIRPSSKSPYEELSDDDEFPSLPTESVSSVSVTKSSRSLVES